MKRQRDSRLLRELKVVRKSYDMQQHEIKWGNKRVHLLVAEADRKDLSF